MNDQKFFPHLEVDDLGKGHYKCKACNFVWAYGAKPPVMCAGNPGVSAIEEQNTIVPSSIEATLIERGKRYGEYKDLARITQKLKEAMHAEPSFHNKLSDDQRETLAMIAHKIGRILNGDPNYHDSWHDIAGYATLTADRILEREREAAL